MTERFIAIESDYQEDELLNYRDVFKLRLNVIALSSQKYRPGLDELLIRTCHELNCEITDVVGKRKDMQFVIARQVFCFWAKALRYSIKDIGTALMRAKSVIDYNLARANELVEANEEMVYEAVMAVGRVLRVHILAKWKLVRSAENSSELKEIAIFTAKSKKSMSIGDEILSCTDLNKLYEIKILLTRRIAQLHKDLLAAKNNADTVAVKGELTEFYAYIEVLNSKVADIKEAAKKEQQDVNRTNYNFRLAAKALLPRELYKELTELSQKTMQDVRDAKKKGDFFSDQDN